MRVNRLQAQGNICRLAVFLMLLGVVSLVLPGCESKEAIIIEKDEMTLSLSSPAFEEGDSIPIKYTCEGQDISPPLVWSEPPEGTQSFVLIMDDPDAPGGVFTHWVIFNISPDTGKLTEAVSAQSRLLGVALQGKNDFGRIGYGGPCPPPGRPHRYQFSLYALEQSLDLKAGASRKQVIEAMQGHVLAYGRLTGTYQR